MNTKDFTKEHEAILKYKRTGQYILCILYKYPLCAFVNTLRAPLWLIFLSPNIAVNSSPNSRLFFEKKPERSNI